MKAKYKAKHRKHEIHKVDFNRRIVLKEVDVEEFAVKLMMCDPMPAMETFRGEVDRYFRQLEGRRGSGIEMSDLIDHNNRVTFVTGIAGSGKSVLVKQLAYKWANGKLFKKFQVCIFFECRELNTFESNEGKKYKKHELIIEFIKSQFDFDVKDSENVLFLVDGVDELKDISEKNSIISQLIDLKKSKYPESKIIITGRPHIEKMLIEHGGGNMGGLRKVEIIGLSDEQTDEYICKFASSDEEIAKINKAKESSKTCIKFLSLPQFLSSFCCVALLSDKKRIRNAAELYCWLMYLLLKKHADKDGSRDKKIPDIFNEYSEDLLALSKICHELLNKNSIIFEGNIELQLVNIGKGKEFLNSLFVDVSDDFTVRMQFKHLTLMEFLSAIYVCTIQNRTEIIKDILVKTSDQVLLFYCQLMSGSMYDGIIKHLFTNAVKLEESDAMRFFCNILTSVRECVHDRNDESFKLSIDVIMCLMNKDVISKQFILSIVNKLSFKKVGKYWNSVDKLIEMMKLLRDDFECSDAALKKAFENVHFGKFNVDELNDLKYAKFLASVDLIELDGYRGLSPMATITVSDIRQEIDGINEWGKVKWVSIWNCRLEDEDVEDKITKSYKLEWLGISGCYVTEQGFFTLLKWMITCEKFESSGIGSMKVEWWNPLVETIENSKKNNDGDFSLRELEMWDCPLMNDEIKEKVITFILIHNYSSFIIICKWFNT